MKKDKNSVPNDMAFETALHKLEEIVETLEKGELTLDEALRRFSEGVSLSKLCLEKLSSAEAQIDIILEEKQGSVATRPLKLQEETPC